MQKPDSTVDHIIDKTEFHHYPGTTAVGCVVMTSFGYQSHGFSIQPKNSFSLEKGKEKARQNALGRLESLEAYYRRREGA